MPTTLDQWRHELQRQGYAPATVDAKLSAVRLAAEHADVDPHELTRDDVLDWVGAPARAPWTRLKYLSHVRAWCAFAGLPDATDGIRRPRQPVGIPRPVSERDLRAMMGAARPGRELAWVILGAFAGLRSHESAKVRGDDLRTPASTPLLHVIGKGGQVSLIPAAPIVVEVIRANADGHGRLWPDATGRAVQAVIRRIAARAGVECSSHQLRHRYGTSVYAVGHDLLETQTLMRHTSPVTTAGYALVSPAPLARTVAALPGADGVDLAQPGTERPRLRLVR